jgi:hypothetical protein
VADRARWTARGRAGAAALGLLGAALTGCGGSSGEAEIPIWLGDVVAAERIPLDSTLVQDIQYVAGHHDRTVLVTRRPPYVRSLDATAAHALGRAVAPSPARRVWGAFAHGDSLWVLAADRWVLWSLAERVELAGGALPVRTVAVAHGCGDRLLAVFAGGAAVAGEFVGDFGLRAHDSGAWWTLSPLPAGEQAAVFTPEAGRRMAAVLPSGEIAVFNGARGRIDVLSCGPLGGRAVPIADLQSEMLPVQALGIVWAGEALVWFWRPFGEGGEVTRVGYWRPAGSPRRARPLNGDVRLFGGPERVWLLDVTGAELLALEPAELLAMIGAAASR